MQTLDHKITITEEDINESIPKSSSHCMIVTGIENEIPKSRYISVDIQTIRFTVDHIRYIYLTPRLVQKAILLFDNGEKPKPFKFRITNPHTIDNTKRDEAMSLTRTSSRRGTGSIPRITGGKSPPKSRNRREFGIRAFNNLV